MTTAMHPTRQKLLDVASELLESASPDEITVDMVLQRSGISKGSLYHHYRDFQDLIESALSNLFVYNVDQSIAALSAVVHGSPDKKTLLAGLRRVTEVTQSSEMRNVRFRRARLLAIAEHRPRLRWRLAGEQARLTTAIAELFDHAQQKGWFNREFDPRAAAVFIQAYSFGKIVDDVNDEPIDPEEWVNLIMKIVTLVFL